MCITPWGEALLMCLVCLLQLTAHVSLVLLAAGISFVTWALHAVCSFLCVWSGSLWCVVLPPLSLNSLQLVYV